MIIAADGIHSVARTAVLGDQLIAKRSGHSAYRALVSPRPSRDPAQYSRHRRRNLTLARFRQVPAELVTSNPRIAHIVAGDAGGTGLTTYMGPDRRLVAYPCRRSQYLNLVAIVVRCDLLSRPLSLLKISFTARLGSWGQHRGVAGAGEP